MFGNRKLKTEILSLQSMVHSYHEEAIDIRKKYVKEKGETEYLRKTLSEYKELLIKEKQYTKELETKIRTQNEADLMFVSINIIKDLLKDKKKEEVREQANLQQQYMNTMAKQQAMSQGMNKLY